MHNTTFVFCAFWLWHVPPEKLDGFLAKIRGRRNPGGTVFAIDSLPDFSRTVERRKLNDRRQFQVVKVSFQPHEVEAVFARHGLRVEAGVTGRFFLFARGSREGESC
jgi:O-methyltransferase involved in polyketide biosynthesis